MPVRKVAITKNTFKFVSTSPKKSVATKTTKRTSKRK